MPQVRCSVDTVADAVGITRVGRPAAVVLAIRGCEEAPMRRTLLSRRGRSVVAVLSALTLIAGNLSLVGSQRFGGKTSAADVSVPGRALSKEKRGPDPDRTDTANHPVIWPGAAVATVDLAAGRPVSPVGLPVQLLSRDGA